MLKSLHIENFAIVDEANVSFDDGLNVITGETGVGKSLIVDALSIALGERAFKDFIRDGYSSAIVEAVFELKRGDYSRLGIDSATITVKREIKLQGSSKVWINVVFPVAGPPANTIFLAINRSCNLGTQVT